MNKRKKKPKATKIASRSLQLACVEEKWREEKNHILFSCVCLSRIPIGGNQVRIFIVSARVVCLFDEKFKCEMSTTVDDDNDDWFGIFANQITYPKFK